MLKEFEYYHGVVFTQLIHCAKDSLNLKAYRIGGNASYVINNKIGIYIKHSAKRLSPWRFSFLVDHQNEIKAMQGEFEKFFLLLVCGDDGIVSISYDQLKQILDEDHGLIEWISAIRSRRKEYTIKGSDGKLAKKISKNDFPQRIIECMVEKIVK
jgi:hypothetical protein